MASCAGEESAAQWQPVSRLEAYLAEAGSDLDVRAVRFGPPADVKKGVTARIERGVLQPVPGELEWGVAVPRGGARLEFTVGFQCDEGASACRVAARIDASAAGAQAERIFAREFLARPGESGLLFFEEALPLDGFSGKDVTLRFGSEVLEGDGAGISIAWGNAVVLALAEAERPNIVLICIDTLRTDRVGAYNPESGLTPVLDALAGDGVVFEQAVSQSPWTLPSVASVLTGLFPSVHGGGKCDLAIDA